MNVIPTETTEACRVVLAPDSGDSERAAFLSWARETGPLSEVTVEFSGNGFQDLDSWHDFLQACSQLAARRVRLFFRGENRVLGTLRSFGVRPSELVPNPDLT